jgi:predicted esterase
LLGVAQAAYDYDGEDYDWGDKDGDDWEDGDWGDKDGDDDDSWGDKSASVMAPFEKQTLPSLNVDPDSITIFGYSCGSWTAHQIGTIFSETIKGQTLCNGGLSFGWETVDLATTRIDQYNADSKVESTSNLVDYPVYIFSGGQDETIPPSYQ